LATSGSGGKFTVLTCHIFGDFVFDFVQLDGQNGKAGKATAFPASTNHHCPPPWK
jgi:hypothetical protein